MARVSFYCAQINEVKWFSQSKTKVGVRANTRNKEFTTPSTLSTISITLCHSQLDCKFFPLPPSLDLEENHSSSRSADGSWLPMLLTSANRSRSAVAKAQSGGTGRSLGICRQVMAFSGWPLHVYLQVSTESQSEAPCICWPSSLEQRLLESTA